MRLYEIAIFTDDVRHVADFYRRLLGAEPVHQAEEIAIFRIGDAQILIHARYEPGPGELPCESHTGFAVDDIDRAVAELQLRGVTIDIPPRDYDWGRSAYLRDPDGHLLELHEQQP